MTFAITKTWIDGEILYSADLNGNFTDVVEEANGTTDTSGILTLRYNLLTDTYNYQGTVDDPGPTWYNVRTFTFTPATTDNVLLGVLWRVTSTGVAEFKDLYMSFSVAPPTQLTTTTTDTTFYSENFIHQNTAPNGGNGVSEWMWVPFVKAVGTGSSVLNTPQFAGQSSYVFTIRQARRHADAYHTKVEFKLMYLDKGLAKTGLIVAS